MNLRTYLNDLSIGLSAYFLSGVYEEGLLKRVLKKNNYSSKGISGKTGRNIFLLSSFIGTSILSLASDAMATINLNQGSLGIGASGILNEATTWVCYRLAPATLTIGLVKGFYDIKQHKPDAARKAFITAAAGTGVMLAPTITGAILGIVQNAGGAANGITIGSGNGSSTVGQP